VYVLYFSHKSIQLRKIAVRDHSTSNGLVDGDKHPVIGKKIQDRAMCCIPNDKEEADY
jgi:hypothetical protein